MKIKYILCSIIILFFTVSSTYGLQWTFQPRVSGTQEYTDNVFLSKDNEKGRLDHHGISRIYCSGPGQKRRTGSVL